MPCRCSKARLDGFCTQAFQIIAASGFRDVRSFLARKIRDFINTKGLAMVQIRCLGGFETKSEAFA